MLKAPGWEMMIVVYFFLGGIAGGAYFTAAIADNFGGRRDRQVAKIGYLLSLPLVALCGLLLIGDLGVPSRFLNMMRVFKFWDPMSIGAWAVGVFGLFTFVSSVLMPFWSQARLMGALFLASGASTGMAAISLILFLTGATAGEAWGKVKKADRFSMIFELVVLAVFLILLGAAAKPMISGHFAPLFWGGLVVVGLLVPLALDVLGHRAKALGAVAAVLVLAGGFVLRYVVLMSMQT